ncbi:polyribonucleotide nucleotidyltransferase [Candidatus Uabimicrobium sp. HlEnr_7]|uniref:polyribonucleotide nucleotidyltransferase n=1 Tax=Candidatus Uabimicrobium helgolandensis TaxID=3095367 RepID=UPI0035580BA3
MKSTTIDIDGKSITFEYGEIARQADGAVIVKQGGTVLLATVVAADKAKEGLGFFPLTVEYREKSAAAGKIPGGFIKRETRPQDREILASRLIDRSVRPLFPKSFLCETQVMVTVFSYDDDAHPEALAIMGAAAALHISDIPWAGPVCGIQIAKNDDKYTVLPTRSERETPQLDLMISCGKEGLIMAEGIAHEVQESDVLEALEKAQQAMKPFFDMMDEWGEGVEKREYVEPEKAAQEMQDDIVAAVKEELLQAVLTPQKKLRSKNIKKVLSTHKENFVEKYPEEEHHVGKILDDLHYNLVRDYMINEKKRIDGRDFDNIRPITGKVGWLPNTHGSSIFTRGETQALVSCTLGTPEDQQFVESLGGERRERFLLHYNFPSYSVGEVRPLRGPGRREIGHGNLALRALTNILPSHKDFVYTIRLVSDVTESNGSSSMATVCGGCLAMMDAGVPVSKSIAGIAMGLIQHNGETVVISDIMGDEDHLGDMDFKVTGSKEGITALQLDNKIGSLPFSILEKAMAQAKDGRHHILDEMSKVLSETRGSLSDLAPRIVSTTIRKDKIRSLIGPGGKNVQSIQEACNVNININSENGEVQVYASNMKDCNDALKKIDEMVGDPEVGKIYRGKVTSVKDFGAFVKFFGEQEGLVHISELEKGRVQKVTDVVNEGDAIVVKVLGIDRGKIKLSRKEALNATESDFAN